MEETIKHGIHIEWTPFKWIEFQWTQHTYYTVSVNEFPKKMARESNADALPASHGCWLCFFYLVFCYFAYLWIWIFAERSHIHPIALVLFWIFVKIPETTIKIVRTKTAIKKTNDIWLKPFTRTGIFGGPAFTARSLARSVSSVYFTFKAKL